MEEFASSGGSYGGDEKFKHSSSGAKGGVPSSAAKPFAAPSSSREPAVTVSSGEEKKPEPEPTTAAVAEKTATAIRVHNVL